uniref:VWFC domain-containing protein n=1 Tax=Rhabditophanes sp. KR3021 TaxID=114890 RepID=A0AC35TS16_9BILA
MKVRWRKPDNQIREISFPATSMVTDDWHKPMLSIRDNKMMVVDDCKILFAMTDFDLVSGKQRHLKMFVGKSIHKANQFAGEIREFSIDHGTPISLLCPYLDTSKLTTKEEEGNEGQQSQSNEEHSSIESNHAGTIADLEHEVDHIRNVVKGLVERVKKVELHQRGCISKGGSVFSFGEKQQNLLDCTECICSTTGVQHCGPIGCPKLNCTHPKSVEGSCCPTCGKECLYNGKTYHDGESFWPKSCVNCHCDDGKMNCQFRERHNCPNLDCLEEDKITRPNQCCPVCKKNDFCSRDHYPTNSYPCDKNADCIHEEHGPKCVCMEGYFGNGTKCYDIDECHIKNGESTPCNIGTVCINSPGSFRCDCFPGFERLDDFKCMDTIH